MTVRATPSTVPIATLVARYAATLAGAGVPSPEVDARLLVRAVLGEAAGRTSTAVRGDDPRLDELARLVAERARRVPLQHVLGVTWFRHLRLLCRPGVFIPRPETEVVAGVAIDAARAGGTAPLVVEPCTGSGAIALAVATEVAGVQVHAGDVSRDAVALARDNLAAVLAGAADVDGLAPGASCSVVPSDLLEGFPAELRGRVDVLVANPPYLPARDRTTWEPELAHDPDPALVGGEDGHEVVAALLAAAGEWLRPGGVVVLEIDDRRGGDAAGAAHAAGLVDVCIVPDLTGADRAVRARRPGALDRSEVAT